VPRTSQESVTWAPGMPIPDELSLTQPAMAPDPGADRSVRHSDATMVNVDGVPTLPCSN